MKISFRKNLLRFWEGNLLKKEILEIQTDKKIVVVHIAIYGRAQKCMIVSSISSLSLGETSKKEWIKIHPRKKLIIHSDSLFW